MSNISNRDVQQPSPEAADALRAAIASGELSLFNPQSDDLQGATDCPEGCFVEIDGGCQHGFLSAACTAGLI